MRPAGLREPSSGSAPTCWQAMMGKTFDSVYESAKEESATEFARSVWSLELEKSTPAPLNLLSLPLKVIAIVLD
eukprot:7253025-Prymnesium_polylepis.1